MVRKHDEITLAWVAMCEREHLAAPTGWEIVCKEPGCIILRVGDG